MTFNFDTHLIILILIMIVSGGFGGYLNYLHNFDTVVKDQEDLSEKDQQDADRIEQEDAVKGDKEGILEKNQKVSGEKDQKDTGVKFQKSTSEKNKKDTGVKGKKVEPERFKYILLGIGAAFLVPAFLNMISSNLASSKDNNDYLIFAGFCLIAAIFSKRFINTLGERILKEAVEAKRLGQKNRQELKENKAEIVITQRDLNTTKERIEDVQVSAKLENPGTKEFKKGNDDPKKLLMEWATSYVEKTSVKDYSQRIRIKAEFGRKMGEIIIRNNLLKEDLLKADQSEGMLVALSYSVHLKPGKDGLLILNKISNMASQLYTKYSILVAYDTLVRNDLINNEQIPEIYRIMEMFRHEADRSLMRKIEDTHRILGLVVPKIPVE